LLPEAEARQRAIGRRAVERWQRMYRIDFEPLLDAATPGPVNMPTETEVAARWAAVGAPTALITIDLTAFERASVNAAADLVVEAPSAVNAVAVTFCRRRVGRRRSGCFPTRCMSPPAAGCGCGTPAAFPERPTGSAASWSRPIPPVRATRGGKRPRGVGHTSLHENQRSRRRCCSFTDARSEAGADRTPSARRRVRPGSPRPTPARAARRSMRDSPQCGSSERRRPPLRAQRSVGRPARPAGWRGRGGWP
jgi:hypothetical protein